MSKQIFTAGAPAFTAIPTELVRYTQSPAFLMDQIRRGMVASNVKWRYYNPCLPGMHRWRKMRAMHFPGAWGKTFWWIRVCESCCRWTR